MASAAASAQLQYAHYRMLEERFDVTLAAPVKKLLDTSIHMREENAEFDIERLGYWMQATATFEEIDPTAYDGLIVPGWWDAEYLRSIPRCVDLVLAHLHDHLVDREQLAEGAPMQGRHYRAGASYARLRSVARGPPGDRARIPLAPDGSRSE